MRILVTGATGFIGMHLVSHLVKLDHQVIVTARNEEKFRLVSWRDKVDFVKYDISDSSERINLFTFFQEPEMVIHLAWGGLPNYDKMYHIENNFPEQYSFLKNLIKNGLQNITVTGTCLEYGLQNGCLNENMISDPLNPYAMAKDFLRKSISQLQKIYSFNYKWIRLFYTYGDFQSPSSIISQLKSTIENGGSVFNMSVGDQLRDYLKVEEVVDMITNLSFNRKFSGIVNCCSGQPISVRKLVEDYLFKRKLTIKLNLGYYPYSEYEPMAFWGDTTRLKMILND